MAVGGPLVFERTLPNERYATASDNSFSLCSNCGYELNDNFTGEIHISFTFTCPLISHVKKRCKIQILFVKILHFTYKLSIFTREMF